MTVGETPGVTTDLAKQYAGEDTHELNMVFQFEHVAKLFPLINIRGTLHHMQTSSQHFG